MNGAAIFEDCPVSNINLNKTNSVQSVSVGNDKVPALCTYSIMWDYWYEGFCSLEFCCPDFRSQSRKDICSLKHSGCLDPKNILSTIDPPPGVPGVSKNHIFFSQMKVFSFCAKIAPKRHKLKKTIKIEEKSSKKPCFHRHFRIFFNLGAILAHQTSYGMFSGSWPIF